MVDYKVTVCKSRKEWLEARKGGLGASDAGAYMGVSPWKSNEQLWKEKCGIVEPEDISDRPFTRCCKILSQRFDAIPF